MFLSNLLSDAAASHGHEFSAPRPTSQGRQQRLSPIPRMRSSPAPRQRPAAITLPKSAVKPVSDTFIAKAEKVMFAEEAEVKILPELELRRSMSSSSEEEESPIRDNNHSRSNRSASLTAAINEQSRRQPRTKTAYSLCHPPPRGTKLSKLKSRPTAVLQLQQVIPGQRAKPAFEVLPSGRYAANLGKHLARLHKGKDRLGAEDVVVIKAQDYDLTDSVEDLTSQQVVGIICASCKNEAHATGNAQLCLEDGSTWEAIPHGKARFDFVTTDEFGMNKTVRWVPRTVRARQRSNSVSGTLSTGPPSPVEVVYRFSTIDTRLRRHPVIATMSPANLDINDTYCLPSSSLPNEDDVDDAVVQERDQAAEREPIETSATLKSLILLSGMYVALRQGWTPAFAYKNHGTTLGRTPSLRCPSRTNSIRSLNPSPPSSLRALSMQAPQPSRPTRVLSLMGRRSTSISMGGGSGSLSPASTAPPLATTTSGHSWTEKGASEEDATRSNSNASHNTASTRSVTPESRTGRTRRDTMLQGIFKSDRWSRSGQTDTRSSFAAERAPSRSTISSASTATGVTSPMTHDSFFDVRGDADASPSAAPKASQATNLTVLGRRGLHTPVHDAASSTSPAVSPRLQKIGGSSLRRHLRSISKSSTEAPAPTITAPDEEPAVFTDSESHPGSEQRHARTWSFNRGRGRTRPTSIVVVPSSQPPQQNSVLSPSWWFDWGRSRSVSRPPTRDATIPAVRNSESQDAPAEPETVFSTPTGTQHPPDDSNALPDVTAAVAIAEERDAWQAEWRSKHGIQSRPSLEVNTNFGAAAIKAARTRPKSLPALAVLDITTTPDEAPKSRRKSLGPRPQSRRADEVSPSSAHSQPRNRPVSMMVESPSAQGHVKPAILFFDASRQQRSETLVDWGQGVTTEKREGERRFGSMMRKVGHKLRRESRKLG